MTAPGRPASGLALVKMPPRPSPNHHTDAAQTIEAARADLTVRGNTRPTAMDSWMRAKAVLAATMWSAIRWADQVMGVAMGAGLPAAVGPMILATKPVLNMYGWNCSAASSSHTRPSMICRARREDGGVGTGSRAAGRAAGAVMSLMGTSAELGSVWLGGARRPSAGCPPGGGGGAAGRWRLRRSDQSAEQSSGRKKMVGWPFCRMLLLLPWCRLRYQPVVGIGVVTPVITRVWLVMLPALSAEWSISMYWTGPWLMQLPRWMCAACMPGLTPLAVTVTFSVCAAGS